MFAPPVPVIVCVQLTEAPPAVTVLELTVPLQYCGAWPCLKILTLSVVKSIVPMFLIHKMIFVPEQYVAPESSSTSLPVCAVKDPEINIYAIPASAIVITNIIIVAITAETPFIYSLISIKWSVYKYFTEKTLTMKRIVLDTNFLIDCVRFKIGLDEIGHLIDEGYKIFIPSPVLKELKKISGRKSKDSNFAKIALGVIEKKEFKVVGMKGKDTDESIIKSVEKDDIVGTDDVELRKKLKCLGNKTIYLRSKKHLTIS